MMETFPKGRPLTRPVPANGVKGNHKKEVPTTYGFLRSALMFTVPFGALTDPLFIRSPML